MSDAVLPGQWLPRSSGVERSGLRFAKGPRKGPRTIRMGIQCTLLYTTQESTSHLVRVKCGSTRSVVAFFWWRCGRGTALADHGQGIRHSTKSCKDKENSEALPRKLPMRCSPYLPSNNRSLRGDFGHPGGGNRRYLSSGWRLGLRLQVERQMRPWARRLRWWVTCLDGLENKVSQKPFLDPG